jgi:ANTAR domain
MDKPALVFLHSTVHQAEGALVASLGIPVHEAAELLRTWAHDKGVTVEEMADEVLGALPGLRSNGQHQGHPADLTTAAEFRNSAASGTVTASPSARA